MDIVGASLGCIHCLNSMAGPSNHSRLNSEADGCDGDHSLPSGLRYDNYVRMCSPAHAKPLEGPVAQDRA